MIGNGLQMRKPRIIVLADGGGGPGLIMLAQIERGR